MLSSRMHQKYALLGPMKQSYQEIRIDTSVETSRRVRRDIPHRNTKIMSEERIPLVIDKLPENWLRCNKSNINKMSLKL